MIFRDLPVAFKQMPSAARGIVCYAQGDLRGILRTNEVPWDALVKQRRGHPCLMSPALAQVIAQSQNFWGAGSKSARNAEALAESGTFCVVTGQQPGLLTGQLYTLFKVSTAVAVARRVEEAVPGCRVVPVFWNASEDSDTEEVASTWILNRDGMPSGFRMDLGGVSDGTLIGALPVGVVKFAELEKWFRENAQETEFLSEILSLLHETWSASSRYSEWFNRILHRMLPESGLVIIESALLETKDLTRHFWEPSLREEGLLHRLLAESEPNLRALGIEPRLKCRSEDTGWFMVQNGERHAIHRNENGLAIAGQEVQLETLVADSQTQFKPGAAFRPLIQDSLFPNLATVVGPHELEYHLQLDPLYRHHSVFRPKVLPRFSGAVVESKVARLIKDCNIQPQDFWRPERELEKSLFRLGQGKQITQWADECRNLISEHFQLLAPAVPPLGEDMAAPVEKKCQRMLQEIASLEDILIRRASQRDEILHNRLVRAKSCLFPNGQWQERLISPFYFLAKYGLTFLSDLDRAVMQSCCQEPLFHFLEMSL